MPGDADVETARTALSSVGADGAAPRQRSTLVRYRARTLLDEAIRTQVLPRLLATHARPAAGRAAIGSRDLDRFIDVIRASDIQMAEAMLRRFADRPATRQELLLDLFTPAARRLHDLWRCDVLCFAELVLAIGRIQSLMRSRAMPEAPPHHGPDGGAVLIASAPDALQCLEATVLGDFFRNGGWRARCIAPATPDELIDEARGRNFDVVVISIRDGCELETVAPLVSQLRRASANKQMRVVAEGPSMIDDTLSRRRTGTDAAACDAASALNYANRLLQAAQR